MGGCPTSQMSVIFVSLAIAEPLTRYRIHGSCADVSGAQNDWQKGNPTIRANRTPPPGPPTGPEAGRTTAQLRAEHKHESSPSQHAVDRITAIVGLPGFAAALTISIAFWVSANVVARALGLWVLDPPPFVWLQGVVTTGALYAAILILITQRREEQLSSQREQLLLELAILNDQKSSKMIQLLEEFRHDNPMMGDRIDRDARVMSKPSDHRAVMDAIKEP